MDGSQRKGNGTPASPCNTPRSNEKFGRDLRSGDGGGHLNSKNDKDKGVNVQVILRCRPLSDEEARLRTPVVISCNESRREVSAMQNIANKQIDRTFVFDKVFGPTSQQKDLFNHSISPIVNEVLEGYNCTIFAYGQTGTGKTYTMEGGGKKAKNGEFPSDAGVIPRSVRQIFETLEAQCAEYSMKVTFLELYNEEITDLLAPDESKVPDDKSKKPIALMEDGKGGVFVRGLEEEVVRTASEIYKILEKGSAKRRTAETLLNKQSSRSHSIFSITIHIKEVTPEGEEMIKIGKLNLVDLAGSENISRSGARDGRAREAGEINKSLLTLGRVINTLVEHSGHIPYRDSKLTRLLRDSLGGKTKTCIIATISPSIYCLEETLSTLDYAHRAKNIKNKPEINQKMMKSAMIKDLYSEIDRLKQEVYAAREKNGIYIPRDRFLQEEAEKKAMAEKIERMEIESESKDKQLGGLQELYNSQQNLSAELSEKLDKTQKKLEDTENQLLDLEERYRQAKCTIREKEYLIANLLQSEKSLVERAHGLHSELENAAADISGLFSKIERKDKIEEGNRILVQQFQSQLTQQLDVLHKTVSSSVTQQENQLKEMEEDMQSFVSAKITATDELRELVEKLKAMFGSGIKVLDDLAGELDENSQSTFGNLKSQVLTHSSALEDCFKGFASEADNLLGELQRTLFNQEDKLNAFARQQREGHLRTVEATRSISNTTINFFDTLDIHVSKLSKILEETQTSQYLQLSELEKKFEECAANEEKQLLAKVAEMLASSSARKISLVQTAVDTLRASAADRTSNLQKEMSNAQDFTSSVKEKWMVYMEETEKNYHQDTTTVESGRFCLEEGLKDCLEKAKMGSKQWKDAQDSLLTLWKGNVASVESIVWNGMEANQLLRAKLSSAAANALGDVHNANNGLHSSINSSLKLDHDACANIDSIIVPSRGNLRNLRSGHYHKIVEITNSAGKCLEEEYMVDEPSCSTPKRRSINFPSVASIEELRTPPFEELLKGFWESKSAAKQINGDVKHLSTAFESHSQALRDSRVPLTTLN
ncbi:kinesin-like protein KIN-5A [Phalaenopsis equestris]|uniref:kinesin-like protein KIN-5A n=1 Tax=Phalaenopsis equestris TaxID=78828 RepID=UPI0009E41CC2|nr:kinesin-like protein KIN-5A [Phalaenopsis equestris]XP_020582998.1 kinesin-like protein KIN-5A [Phalaenopsis equestris]